MRLSNGTYLDDDDVNFSNKSENKKDIGFGNFIIDNVFDKNSVRQPVAQVTKKLTGLTS